MFEFEKLDVYQLALEFFGDVENVLREVPSKEFAIIDQLKRAALSIPLNIAEGAGRWHDKEKRQFYFISRGSTFECIPVLTLLAKRDLIKPEILKILREKLIRLVQMLTKLAQSVDIPRDRDT